jgi:hypothetical protein
MESPGGCDLATVGSRQNLGLTRSPCHLLRRETAVLLCRSSFAARSQSEQS